MHQVLLLLISDFDIEAHNKYWGKVSGRDKIQIQSFIQTHALNYSVSFPSFSFGSGCTLRAVFNLLISQVKLPW